jgi:hypothetical protein
VTTNERGQDQQADAGVGSVAEEAARLVEVLAAFGGAPGSSGDAADPSGEGTAGSDHSGSAGGRAEDAEAAGESGQAGPCTCGGRRPAACAVCPLCQVIAFVQRLNPETVDQLAEVVELAATGLRDFAVVQRSRRAQARPDEDLDVT